MKNNHPSQDEKIKDLENKISELSDYIKSYFCIKCFEVYEKLKEYKKELGILLNKDVS